MLLYLGLFFPVHFLVAFQYYTDQILTPRLIFLHTILLYPLLYF